MQTMIESCTDEISGEEVVARHYLDGKAHKAHLVATLRRILRPVLACDASLTPSRIPCRLRRMSRQLAI